MLHRGPMNRLTATMSTVPVFSTCLILLLQAQIFHALPTSSSSAFDELPLLDNHSAQGASASSPSSSYQPTNSYSSYRPGARLDSYRSYRDYYPKEDSAPAGLYIGESAHPNSVYSPESILTSSPQNQEKVLQYVEKELANSESIKITLNKDQTTDEQNSSPVVLPRRRNNKPRLAPLPSVPQFRKEHVVKDEKREEKHLEPLPNPIPPPFAPELDPNYERNLYGLGSLTLLDQAGPFW